ncbi:MAG: MMPL family transporter, partial [Acidobacteriota bacterium]
PVRALGLWSAFGIVFLTLTMLVLYPALLATLPGPRSRDRGPGGPAARGIELRAGALGRGLAGAAIARHRAVTALFTLLAVAAGAGILRLRIETDVLAYFREGSVVRAETTALEAQGIGTVAASLVLRGDGLRLDTPEALRRQAELTALLGREPLVLGALSAGDLVADVARRSTHPDGTGGTEGTGGPGAASLARAEVRIRREPDLDRMLAYLLTADGARTRITLLVPMRGYEELAPLFGRVRAEARRLFPDAEVGITGQYPLVLAAQRTLLRTMVLSLTLTALGVAIVLRLLLGSLALTARALVPNLWPVLFVLGVMGWSGLPVDSATVMVASVVLGLAVDDTLHSLGSFRRLVARSPAPEAAIRTLGETAGAHALTSIILTVGFGVVGLCELVPVARFGALAAVAVAVALAADLTLVPTLLARAPRRALARLANRDRAALRRPRDAG